MTPSRARIQFSLPWTVLISPLWASIRYGCASGQLGNVFVLKRECTSASALSKRSSREVGIELAELVGREHALVDDDPAAQRREVRVGLVLDALAGEVDVPFELVAGEPVLGHEHLHERGHLLARGRARARSASIGTDRHPSTAKPSSASTFATASVVASTRSTGTNAMPVAYAPSGGSSKSTVAR